MPNTTVGVRLQAVWTGRSRNSRLFAEEDRVAKHSPHCWRLALTTSAWRRAFLQPDTPFCNPILKSLLFFLLYYGWEFLFFATQHPELQPIPFIERFLF